MTHKEMSKKGGQVKSEAKTKEARANAKKPRGKWVTALGYEYVSSADGTKRFGCQVVLGKPPHCHEKMIGWATDVAQQYPPNRLHPVESFLNLDANSILVK